MNNNSKAFAILEKRIVIYNPKVAKIEFDYVPELVEVKLEGNSIQMGDKSFCACCGRSEYHDDLRLHMVGVHKDNDNTKRIYEIAQLKQGWLFPGSMVPNAPKRFREAQGEKFNYSFLNCILYVLECFDSRLGNVRIYPSEEADLWLEWDIGDWDINVSILYDVNSPMFFEALNHKNNISVSYEFESSYEEAMKKVCGLIRYVNNCNHRHVKRVMKKHPDNWKEILRINKSDKESNHE
jgi:hypothetical protein